MTPPDTQELTPEQLLDFPLPENDSGAGTVRGYLAALLAKLWTEGDSYDIDAPFGTEDWKDDLYAPLVEAGVVSGGFDSRGYLERVDNEAADKLVLAAIEALGVTEPEPDLVSVATAYLATPGEGIPAPG
jgi:hypothetical protein